VKTAAKLYGVLELLFFGQEGGKEKELDTLLAGQG